MTNPFIIALNTEFFQELLIFRHFKFLFSTMNPATAYAHRMSSKH